MEKSQFQLQGGKNFSSWDGEIKISPISDRDYFFLEIFWASIYSIN